jgi:MoaA/NifB/PqqE/SkfB family radical SAM enzyme
MRISVMPWPRRGRPAFTLRSPHECNLTCKTCPLTYGRVEPPTLFTVDKVRFVVAQFPSATRMVLHGIGEPLLNRELPQIISYLKAEGKYVLFNSKRCDSTDIADKGPLPSYTRGGFSR